jgi:hypothetical protein
MLEYLFANKSVEKVLIYLSLHGEANASQLRTRFDSALDPIQKALGKLEKGGLLVSSFEGRVRVFKWNASYPLLKEIQTLAKNAYEQLPNREKQLYQTEKKKVKAPQGRSLGLWKSMVAAFHQG